MAMHALLVATQHGFSMLAILFMVHHPHPDVTVVLKCMGGQACHMSLAIIGCSMLVGRVQGACGICGQNARGPCKDRGWAQSK